MGTFSDDPLAFYIKVSGLKVIRRRNSVPFTLLAEMDGDLLRDSLRDVHLGPQAGDAHVCWIRRDGNTARAAQAA